MASPAAVHSIFFSQCKKTPTHTVCAPFVRTVWLHNWWLIKVGRDSEGRGRLGVGGFASTEGQETRAFFSAPISKRHDTVTLETTDGITITIIGFINRSRTVENGFPSEVINRFCLGFPHNWEEYSGRFCSEESVNRAIPSSISSILDGFDISSVDGTDSSLPTCLNDLPVTHVRDLLMCSRADYGELEKCIVNDIMQYFGDNETVGKEKRKDNDSVTHPPMSENFVHEQIPRNHNKTKAHDKFKDITQPSTDRGELDFEKITGECKTDINFDSLRRGVVTRSMARLSNSRNTKHSNVSPNTCVTGRLAEVFGEGRGDGSASRENDQAIFSDAQVEADVMPHICTVPIGLESLSEPLSKAESSNKQCGGAVSGEEVNVNQIHPKSAVRRSDRLKKIYS